MAALTQTIGRIFDLVALQGSATTVAVDALSTTPFTIPAGFGSALIMQLETFVSSLSGDYVVPAFTKPGVLVHIRTSDAASEADQIGVAELQSYGGTAARPDFAAQFEKYRGVLCRQTEIIYVMLPVLAGAGVTATVSCRVMARKITSA